METKLTQPVEVISVSTKVTLKTIMQDIGTLPEELLQDMQNQDVVADGPMIFVYRGCSDCEQPFDLDITQPVASSDNYKGKYEAKTLEPFKCVERTYNGSMHEMSAKGYEPFMADVEKSGLNLSDQCREIYTFYEGPDSDNNITEIQLGIAEEVI